MNTHLISPPYDPPTETGRIYAEARADDLFCDAMNLRNTEWLSRVDSGDVYELAAAILLLPDKEGRAKAYEILEAISGSWADDEARAEQ